MNSPSKIKTHPAEEDGFEYPDVEGVCFTPAEDEDKDFIRELHKRTYFDLVIQQFGEWDDEFQELRFHKKWENQKYMIIHDENTDDRIGVIWVEVLDGTNYLQEILLEPDHRNQGIGTKIIKALKSQSENNGQSVVFQVMKANKEAQRFYERLGFDVFAETDTHYVMGDKN